ncbi:MAG TPA: hypothetical protein VJQ55_05550 [Candidatus Binatia bacterium]|nr:hypothetical protein [Candidatus Binatia bacterium]
MNSPEKLSKSLRVIGQLLQQRGLEFFDVRSSDEGFVLQCGGPTPPYLDLVEFRCSPQEVEQLDARARAARGNLFKTVNFESLSEILRAIGDRIEDREAQLLRFYNSDLPVSPDSITIEYRTRNHRRHVEKLLFPAAGEYALRMYKSRGGRVPS